MSQEVQSEGWTFNTAYNQSVSPRQSDNRILIRAADNTDERDFIMQMDLSHNTFYSRDKDSIAKADGEDIYLYDRIARTFDWGTQPVEVDIITYISKLGEIPPAAANYIVAKASAVVAMRTVGDPQQYQILLQQEAYCRTQFLEYETSSR